ncbi:MAG: hypothetical protein HKN39_05755 [Flavobacteriales bacterium]|nr:hypothetical protein [Flavobacteriales bacterium]
MQSGDKNYLKIFDVIDKQDDYDEEAIKDMFKNETFIKHFPSEKNHLYKLILKSLRSYHSDDSISSILKQEIKNIEILYKKALFKECNKFLNRAKKLAIEHEKFYYLFELLNWEKILLEEAYEEGEFTKDLDVLINEEKEVIERLRNLAAYHILYSKINYVFRSGGYVRGEAGLRVVEEISNHPLIIGKNTALSKRATTICYYIQGFCALAKLDRKNCIKKFTRVKEIFDANPKIRKDLPKRYIRTLSNLILCYIDMKKYDEAKELLAELKKIIETKGFQSTDIKVMAFKSTSLAEMKMYNRTGEFDKAVEEIQPIIAELDSYREKINKEQEILFYYNIAYIYFGSGEYNKALFWINKVLNDNESSLRQDIYSYARLFNLIIHFELGNYDLLEYIIKSTSRYLNKRNRAYQVENLIMTNIKKLSKAHDDDQRHDLFLQMKKDLKELLKDNEEKIVLEYFDLITWLNSKISKATLSEEVKISIS